ncbi:DUF1127 domain-containing protein (plasmid) [Microvirga terrae]|uniref:DUF1127 domain-containing protein n=1 Tax=Microvirga terrae TaxID=2740529 RepID=A0ABY5RZL1_9HYPH|nr:DUF1127 domain-containing protein [Microvirga terrae]UVF22675.1 DUF1127 domain-containing protein [Microvirga terrae]
MFIAFIMAKISAYLHYRQVIRELMQLSDRELDDIGISRNDIDGIARQSAAS